MIWLQKRNTTIRAVWGQGTPSAVAGRRGQLLSWGLEERRPERRHGATAEG